MSNNLTPYEEEIILQRVSKELKRMNTSQIESIRYSEQSFSEWVSECLTDIGRTIGIIIAAPFKFIRDVFRGFFEAIFG